VDEIAAPDMLLKYSLHEPRRGHADIKAFMSDFRKAFPDLYFWGTADLIAEGDYVVGQWEGGGTHTGPVHSSSTGPDCSLRLCLLSGFGVRNCARVSVLAFAPSKRLRIGRRLRISWMGGIGSGSRITLSAKMRLVLLIFQKHRVGLFSRVSNLEVLKPQF
jgi:SnoaL-like polyketide cyclase